MWNLVLFDVEVIMVLEINLTKYAAFKNTLVPHDTYRVLWKLICIYFLNFA